MYAYSFFAITDCDGRIAAILIARVCGDGEANCLRIVDLIGDAAYLACVRTQIQELLQAENYEYIDFLEFGLEDQLLKNGGFINRGEYADVIVPNYFEPFLRENVDLRLRVQDSGTGCQVYHFQSGCGSGQAKCSIRLL